MLTLTSPVETWAHRLPAGVKLAALALATTGLFSLSGVLPIALAFAATVGLVATGGRKFAVAVLRLLWPLWPFVVVVVAWHLWTGEVAGGTVIILRLITAVTLANAVGTGVADDKAVYCFVPQIIKYYLDQDPILENVETYMASEDDHRSHILANLDKLVVKSANEAGGYGMLMGPWASKDEIEMFRRNIEADPRNFIAQNPISLSRHPTWMGEDFQGRHIDLRPYVLYGEKVTVTPAPRPPFVG
jgi:hypothetical protein